MSVKMRLTGFRHLCLSMICLGAAAFSAFAAVEPGATRSAANDQVIASFEREMQREPVPAKPIRRQAIEQEALYRAMNEVHWTQDAPAPAGKGDCLREHATPKTGK